MNREFNQIYTKFIHSLNKSGRKKKASSIMKQVLLEIRSLASREEVESIVTKGVTNIKPLVHLKSVRIAGVSYKIPYEIDENKQYRTAIKWIVQGNSKSKHVNDASRIAQEIFKASKSQGTLIKKKEEIHKMSEQNRAYLHYRW
uniref:Ribosomal protein S7 n=1 Tax=Imasa heleensis TaxID=2772037 RepID=A0A893DCX7_9EUKA|nr:ribosomal protein S7 [Imasa heleensis]QRR29746.1 ribosomal protein S7 [Imasa heleensis]